MEAQNQPCPSCGYANRPGKRFCGGCGSPLASKCTCCGTENPAGARFCDECGVPLSKPASAAIPAVPPQTATPAAAVSPAPAPAASSEERRLVTSLFCDLVGFTPLSEQLDPEEVREIQADYFGLMSAQIERYGGMVQKYAGDAVLAFFGAPVAHEDDAERAVLCAIGMQSAIEPLATRTRARWNVEPAIRIGVNTGEVVSGVWEVSGRLDVDITGDAVNTAARFQSSAQPGEIVVGAETMRLTRRRVHYGEQRDLVLKGKTSTVPGFPVIGVREHFGERWETSQEATPLVGRDEELRTLMGAWTRAWDGVGQLVTIVADAGVGKSRLISELLELVTPTADLRVLRARCLSYGQSISLWLIVDLLRTLFGIREQELPDEIRVKLRGGVQDLLGDDTNGETQAEAVDVLGEVLGLAPADSVVAHAGAQVRRQALVKNLKLVLEAVTARKPTILVLEDLHWLDPASQEILTEVLAEVPGRRLLVLVAQRPLWIAPWSDWSWSERMLLRPLELEAAAVLAGSVLGGVPASPELEHYIAERAGGNPFFIEEMLRSLQETGDLVEKDGQMVLVQGAAQRLPSTLTEVLQARLDRLDAGARTTAQVASVIGRYFAVRLLAEMTRRDPGELDPALSGLQRAEIAFPRQSEDLEYVFKHVSMREAAYNSLLQKRRRQLHLEAARAVAALYPADEYVEMIAYHYSRTEEHAEAAIWLERAGDHAAAIYASETALGNYREARRKLEQCGAKEATLARIDEKYGAVLYTAGRYDEALEPLERASDAYRQVEDLEAAGRVVASIGMAHRYRGTPDEGIPQVQSMLARLEGSGPSEALASLYIALASLFFLTGKYRETRETAEKAADIARAVENARLLGEAEERRGTALLLLGEPDEALRVLEGALPLVEAGGDFVVLWRALNNTATVCEKLGRMDLVKPYTERALEVAERMGNPSRTAFILANLGSTLITLGDWGGARTQLDRAMNLAVSAGHAADAAIPLQYLGQLCLWQGDLNGAHNHLREGLILAQQSGDRQNLEMVQAFLAELDLVEGRPAAARSRLEPLVAQEDATLGLLLPVLAWTQLELGDLPGADDMARQAVERASEHSEQYHAVHALWVQSMVLMGREQWGGAERALDEGLDLARSMPFPYLEARLLHAAARLRLALSEPEGAQERLERAGAIFRRLGARLDAERTDQSLLEVIAERAFSV
jgi:adenylate cyclase